MLRTTPFEKGLITVINKGKLILVFIVPAAAVAVAYRSCPSTPPPSFLAIGFLAVPFGCMSADCRVIKVGPLRKHILHLLRTEKMGS